METPLLYRQLEDQLRQWVKPKDQRHLQGFAEMLAAILQSGQACLSKWIPYLAHRGCSARAHLERLSYFLRNEQISAERFYRPLLSHVLSALGGEGVLLTLDTSLLWNQFCLIEVCLVWGGRALTVSQSVMDHRSASIRFEQYKDLLESARQALPPKAQVTLLADRGFEHGELMRWLNRHDWHWLIRVKSDLLVTTANGKTQAVERLFPPANQAYLFRNVQVLEDIEAHLATANLPEAQDTWAVLSNQPPSLQTFALYGRRFGGIEPHFKDYKSAAFDLLDSGLREAKMLTRLVMLIDAASLIALVLASMLVNAKQRRWIDWHGERGLSFLQLGLRECARLCYQRLPLPKLKALSRDNPPPACASQAKRNALDCRIEFAKVVVFSS